VDVENHVEEDLEQLKHGLGGFGGIDSGDELTETEETQDFKEAEDGEGRVDFLKGTSTQEGEGIEPESFGGDVVLGDFLAIEYFLALFVKEGCIEHEQDVDDEDQVYESIQNAEGQSGEHH
jgi:hypothetical protein